MITIEMYDSITKKDRVISNYIGKFSNHYKKKEMAIEAIKKNGMNIQFYTDVATEGMIINAIRDSMGECLPFIPEDKFTLSIACLIMQLVPRYIYYIPKKLKDHEFYHWCIDKGFADYVIMDTDSLDKTDLKIIINESVEYFGTILQKYPVDDELTIYMIDRCYATNQEKVINTIPVSLFTDNVINEVLKDHIEFLEYVDSKYFTTEMLEKIFDDIDNLDYLYEMYPNQTEALSDRFIECGGYIGYVREQTENQVLLFLELYQSSSLEWFKKVTIQTEHIYHEITLKYNESMIIRYVLPYLDKELAYKLFH